MILDTNALSALAYDDRAILDRLHRPDTPMPYPCLICLGAYRKGILGSTKPGKLLAVLEKLCSSWQTLHSDDETTTHHAEIAHLLKTIGRPIPTNDIWIAAPARQHSMPILSRDHHFDFIPDIRRVDW